MPRRQALAESEVPQGLRGAHGAYAVLARTPGAHLPAAWNAAVARVLQSLHIMIMLAPDDNEICGHIAYVDPSRQWGYLHGPHGERVYFHASDAMYEITDLAPGAQVYYRTVDRDHQPCPVQIVRSELHR